MEHGSRRAGKSLRTPSGGEGRRSREPLRHAVAVRRDSRRLRKARRDAYRGRRREPRRVLQGPPDGHLRQIQRHLLQRQQDHHGLVGRHAADGRPGRRREGAEMVDAVAGGRCMVPARGAWLQLPHVERHRGRRPRPDPLSGGAHRPEEGHLFKVYGRPERPARQHEPVSARRHGAELLAVLPAHRSRRHVQAGKIRFRRMLRPRARQDLPDGDSRKACRRQRGGPPDLEADAHAAVLPHEPLRDARRRRPRPHERLHRGRRGGRRHGHFQPRPLPPVRQQNDG